MAKISTKFYTYFLLGMLGLVVLFPLTQATYEGFKIKKTPIPQNNSLVKIKELNEKITKLTNDVTDANNKKANATADLANAQSNLTDAQSKLTDAQSKLDNAKQELKNYQDSIGTKGPTPSFPGMPTPSIPTNM
jgi:hypothetical protein